MKAVSFTFWSWILIPLALLSVGEVVARRLVQTSMLNAQWYRGALDAATHSDLDFIFVGTSRTRDGVVIDVWDRELEHALGKELTCFNFGRPYAGPVAHLYGLRELVERFPERMRGCTVLFEMSAGLPEYTWDWETPGYHPGNAQLIVDYMKAEDLKRFLSSPASFDARVGMIIRYLGRSAGLMAGRRSIRQAIDFRLHRQLKSTLDDFGATYRNDSTESPALESSQLRTDPQGVAQLREIIRSRVDPRELATQEPYAPWNVRIVCQTAEYLQSHGVRVAFHEVLAPSYLWTVHETETRRKDREAFARWTKEREIPWIESGFAVTDDDFPDLSHLRSDKIGGYTRALAKSYLERARAR